jgi:hypothetical protein
MTTSRGEAALSERAFVGGRGWLRTNVRVRSRRLPAMVNKIQPLFFAMITS